MSLRPPHYKLGPPEMGINAQYYKDANSSEFTHSLGNINNYSVTTRIGRGKYSNVFAGHDRDGNKVVIKVLKPVRIPKINREIAILEALRGGPNISQLCDVVRDEDSGSISLILDYSINHDVKALYTKMTSNDISRYIYCVLKALSFSHHRGIMHRDVKPGNIMWNMETKTASLIDWGLAEFYAPGEEYQVRVATKHYKGPELLLGYTNYEPSLDIWCLGCTLAGLLFYKLPFFKGHDTDEQIEYICSILGGQAMLEYVDKYDINISPYLATKIVGKKRRLWGSFINDNNHAVCTSDALDLLTKMLTIDHKIRPSADECMRHPFFDQIRDEME